MDEIKIKKKWWEKLIPIAKKSYNLKGYYIPLRIINAIPESESDKTHDWWTKYYDTLRMRKTLQVSDFTYIS